MQAVILCGGLGTRMGGVPKSLIEVQGQPFIRWQIRHLSMCGVEDILLLTGHGASRIQQLCPDCRCVPDGDVQLGTAGALAQALPHLSEEFYLYYGDSFVLVDVKDLANSRKPFTLAIGEPLDEPGNVSFEPLRYEKHAGLPYIDAGLARIHRSLVTPNLTGDLAPYYSQWISQGVTYYTEYHEVGSPAGLKRFETWLKRYPMHTWSYWLL